jgi:hypothetical protein
VPSARCSRAAISATVALERAAMSTSRSLAILNQIGNEPGMDSITTIATTWASVMICTPR